MKSDTVYLVAGAGAFGLILYYVTVLSGKKEPKKVGMFSSRRANP